MGDAVSFDALHATAIDAGLVAFGATTAEPFGEALAALEQRRAAGLAADMQFTYRNPQRSTDPRRALPTARTLLVGAHAYPADVPATAPPGPHGRVARYATADHYAALRRALAVVADLLVGAGWQARVLADDNALVDRAAARRAGIGSFGRNANLLLAARGGDAWRGSYVVLGAVLTDAVPEGAPVHRPAPLAAPVCGSCTRCIDACPTAAIVEPGVIDARRCLAWLVQQEGVFPAEHRAALGDRLYGCDVCQEVCPPNRRSPRGAPTDPDDGPGPFVSLRWLLRAGDDELLDRLGRWYLPRREPRYLRRNALVVLGNVGRGDDPADAALVVTALAHADAIVRGHAVWAAARLGRTDLLRAVADDPDPAVQAELAAVAAGTVPARPVGA